MQIINIHPRRRGLSAVTLLPPPEQGIAGAEYDGERLLLDREILARCSIEKGMELSVDELKKLIYVSECYRAKQRAVWHLSQSDYSEKLLYDKLCRSFTKQASAFAVAQMVKKGYLNDRKYADRLIEKLKCKNMSHRAVQDKLMQKGVSAETAKEALQCVMLSQSDAERALVLLKTKYRSKLTDKDDVRKTIAALQRRGFAYSDIKTALDKLQKDIFEGEEID